MKKLFSLFLLVLLVLPTFAGGNRQTGTSTGSVSTAGGLPLTTEDVTFSVFIAGGLANSVTSFDYKDNAFTKKITDETGIKLDIISSSDADANTRLNAMLASGQYPDIILTGYTGFGSINNLTYWGSQGILIPLDKYNIKSYPNIKKVLDEYPAADQRIRGADGHIYGLPYVNDCLHCIYSYGRAWYHMPFLRDNNRKVPETIAEFTDYLRWVRDNDVNKNGNRNDEIPIAFSAPNLRQFISFISKAYMPFIFTSDHFGLGLNKGRVWEQYREKEFRQALATMAGWYKEGLIAPNSFTMTDEQVRNVIHNEPAVVGVHFWAWNGARQPSARWAETFHLKPLAGPAGQRNSGNSDPWSILDVRMVITDKCKDPVLAIAWYDYCLNFEVQMAGYIGPKGEAWGAPDPGSRSLKGATPLYKLLTTFGGQQINSSWNQMNPLYQSAEFRLGEQAAEFETAQKWWETGDPSLRDRIAANSSYNEINNYYYANADVPWTIPTEYFIPPVALNDADNDRVSDINSVLNPYLDQAISEFITGSKDINNDSAWNAFLSELDRIGAKDRTAIYQKYIK
ncbi:MAG: extracellular solute-binding protein [Treponema sp.]|nr:extracellular solute-binding protein [Treponema sp.]